MEPLRLFADDIDKAEEKQGCEEVEHPVLAKGVAGTTSEELEKSIAGETEAQTIGDGPCKGDGRDRQESGDGVLGVVPLNMGQTRGHEGADEDESGRGGETGDRSYERGDEEREEEEDAGDDGGDAGTASGSDSGGGFDVAGDGAGAG